MDLNEVEQVVRYVGGSHIDSTTRVINGSAFDGNYILS